MQAVLPPTQVYVASLPQPRAANEDPPTLVTSTFDSSHEKSFAALVFTIPAKPKLQPAARNSIGMTRTRIQPHYHSSPPAPLRGSDGRKA